MEQSKLLGTIIAVSGSNISVALSDNLDLSSIGNQGHRICQIGSYVVMPQAEKLVVGTIISIRDESAAEGDGAPHGRRYIEVSPLGTLQQARFERGVTLLPIIGDPVYATDPEDVRTIFAAYRDYDFSLGKISLFEEERLYIDPNKFFGKHLAVFGSTGSGKSFTVATILQKVAKFANSHVIILDLHGEYGPAFGEWGEVFKINELELPYWIMNFEELVETFIDENEASANNQMMVMKEAVLDSRSEERRVGKECRL